MHLLGPRLLPYTFHELLPRQVTAISRDWPTENDAMTSLADGTKHNKRVKTFTGCWTCRRRKVKCDEHKPICRQCVAKRLECEGYGVRLRWMGPGIDLCDEDEYKPPSAREARPKSQRSRIAFDPGPSPLGLSEVDSILRLIDTFAVTNSQIPGDAGDSLLLSHFGVFKGTASRHEECLVVPNPDPRHGLSFVSLSAPDMLDDAESWSTGNRHDDVHWDRLAQQSPSLPKVPLHGHSSIDQPTQEHESTSTQQESLSSPRWEDQYAVGSDGSVALEPETDQDSTSLAPPRQFWWELTNGTIVRNPSPIYMTRRERFLMYHYAHRVVHLFCVIDNDKSPWKTIHLPRVLQSVGQLTVQGTGSTTRDALRNALLSISAFYLCNDSRSRRREDEAARWSNDAIMFQSRAIKLLKDAVEGSSTAPSPPKYKELLATMLSMVTINVMSGDNTTCGIHLDGTLRFLKHATGWKSKYSTKARSLQRIYFYLRVIYDSTALRSSTVRARQLDPSSTDPGHAAFPSPSPSGIMTLVDTSEGQSQTPSHPIAPGVPMSMSTYECIYGVPQSLLVLLERSTDLIKQVASARHEGDCSSIPANLMARCDALENEIVDWDTEPGSLDHLVSGNRASSEIIRKTTLAFHNALVIYFAQHIRLIRFSYLRPHVKIVLDSITAIEQLKSQASILAAPLYWPAFIAGSEAFDRELQDGFKKWYSQVEFYGIASARTGSEVLARVWDAGPSSDPRLTSHWRMVVEGLGSMLMLS